MTRRQYRRATQGPRFRADTLEIVNTRVLGVRALDMAAWLRGSVAAGIAANARADAPGDPMIAACVADDLSAHRAQMQKVRAYTAAPSPFHAFDAYACEVAA